MKKKGVRLGDGVFTVATGSRAKREQLQEAGKGTAALILQGPTGTEEDGGNCPLRCDPDQGMTEGNQPKADQESTQKAV
ncbi:hypothetical protein NDU88_006900 [Pleurodeles waltl]|uniref:Uncharacterized protein n=1 Tax=Pleurodeles waltl TaxID=8319 RepID=A0AAV7UNK7_PLEWA|nr:hypothetical protein NDU88_006900 [Pleurodeles waltl]